MGRQIHSTSRDLSRPRPAFLAALLAAAVISTSALSADWPELKPGQWELKRTVSGAVGKHTTTISRCTDPIADMQNQNGKMTKAGCTFSPITRSANVYRFSADCANQNVKAHSETVITVASDSAYSLHVATVGGMTSEETLVARRTGDCLK